MRNPVIRLILGWCLILIICCIVSSLCIGCATTQSLTGPARPAISYRCDLDSLRCALIANAAAISTAEGWPVVERRDGAIVFLPGDAESVFAGACDVERLGGFALSRVCTQHAIEMYPAMGVVRVNIIPGALYRRSDFVTVVLDEVFVKVEGR